MFFVEINFQKSAAFCVTVKAQDRFSAEAIAVKLAVQSGFDQRVKKIVSRPMPAN